MPSATRRVSLSRSNSALLSIAWLADQAAEREAREQVGGGDADPCGGGMQAMLGGGDVGTTAQQVARRARIEPGRQRRQWLLRA